MQLFLLDSGKEKVAPVYTKTRQELSEAEIEMNDFFLNALGHDVVNEIITLKGEKPKLYKQEYWGKYGNKIKTVYKNYLKSLGINEDGINNIINNTTTLNYIKFVKDAYTYSHEGSVKVTTKYNSSETNEAILNTVDANAYKKWIDDLYKGVEEKSGIRNNVDYFTASGNRRSWDALHYENNLENVIKIMKADVQKGKSSFFAGHGIWGVAAKEYGSIAEIKADSNRLNRLNEEDYKTLKENYGERLSNIANSIKDDREKNPFIALDSAMEQIIDAIRTKKTKAGIFNTLKQYNDKVTMKTVEDIVSLVKDIANMPTEYFEAKPQRAVYFDEVATAIIPDNASDNLKSKLNDHGITFIEYKNGNENSRLEALNSLDDVKFSERDYSYESLISKPDMKIITVDGIVPSNRADVVFMAKKNAASVGKSYKDGSVAVHVDDIDTDVILATKGLRHGLRRTQDAQNETNYIVTLKAGEILKNSIRINELNSSKENATGSYILIGIAQNKDGDLYIVQSVVNQFNNELDSIDVLYAINAKKELAALNAPRFAAKPLSVIQFYY